MHSEWTENFCHRFSLATVLKSWLLHCVLSVYTRPLWISWFSGFLPCCNRLLTIWTCVRFVSFWFSSFNVVSCAKLFEFLLERKHAQNRSLSHWLTEMAASKVQIKCAVAFYSLWFDLICFRSLWEFLQGFFGPGALNPRLFPPFPIPVFAF